MNRTKQLTCACNACGAPISFPVESIGTLARCPHCGQQTELSLAPPPEDSSASRKGMIWAAIAVVILVVGLAGPFVGLRYFQKWAAPKRERALAATAARVAQAAAQIGLNVSGIGVQKLPGDSPLQAIGTVSNCTSRQLIGVTLELRLYDASGQFVDTVRASKQVLEPGAQWEFREAVRSPKAVAARLAAIKEGQ